MSAVVTTAVAGWFLILGGVDTASQAGKVLVPVPYESYETCRQAGLIATSPQQEEGTVRRFSCVPTDPKGFTFPE